MKVSVATSLEAVVGNTDRQDREKLELDGATNLWVQKQFSAIVDLKDIT